MTQTQHSGRKKAIATYQGTRLRHNSIDLLALGVVGVVAILHLPLIFRINIGWDEFRFLSDVYAYQRGNLTNALQTIHVHLFSWLPLLGGSEVDQILAARGVYFLLLLGSCGFIYLISTTFLTRAAAFFAVLLFLTCSEVLGFATTFRFDGLGVFFLLGSLTLLVRNPSSLPALLGAGSLAALAAMVTVKSVFYLPTLFLVQVISAHQGSWRRSINRGFVLVGAFLAFFGFTYFVHSGLLPDAKVANLVRMLQRTGPTAIKLADPFPQLDYLLVSVLSNPGTWLFLALGVVVLLRRLSSRTCTRESLVLLAIALPLGSLAIYRNSFPYYFVFVMPVATIVAAVSFDELMRRRQASAMIAAASMALVVLLGFGVHYNNHWTDETIVQRQLVEMVHRMFPEPVPYVDPNSMIASFPKVGFFMSHWGLEHYHAAGKPIFEDLLMERKPVFLLAHYPLWLEDPAGEDLGQPDRLLPADLRVLRENYIHHWGTIYVAGQRIRVSASEPRPMRTIIPGPYTVEAEGPVFMDGRELWPGDVVILEPGWVQLQAGVGSFEVTLRWGRDLYRPSEPLHAGAIFSGFYPCGSPFSSCRAPSL